MTGEQVARFIRRRAWLRHGAGVVQRDIGTVLAIEDYHEKVNHARTRDVFEQATRRDRPQSEAIVPGLHARRLSAAERAEQERKRAEYNRRVNAQADGPCECEQ